MNLIDLLALTPIVTAGTALATIALHNWHGRENIDRASRGGLPHFDWHTEARA